jgi:phosphotransferase system enzyme I (PtsI)
MGVAAERTFYGIPVSAGVACERAFALTQEKLSVPSYQISPDQISSEISRFEAAILETRSQLVALRGELTEKIGETWPQFRRHLLILEGARLSRKPFAWCTRILEC